MMQHQINISVGFLEMAKDKRLLHLKLTGNNMNNDIPTLITHAVRLYRAKPEQEKNRQLSFQPHKI